MKEMILLDFHDIGKTKRIRPKDIPVAFVLEPFLPDTDQPFLRDFLEENPDYSNFADAENHGLISQLQEMDQYTFFVPTNAIFPQAANFTIREDYLKYYVVPQVLLTPALDDGQTASTLLGITHQLQFHLQGDRFLKSFPGSGNVTALLDNRQGAVTIFLPAVPAESISGRFSYEDYILADAVLVNENLVTMSNATGVLSSSGLTLNFTRDDKDFYVNGVKIIERNIETINGYINLIAHSFEKVGLRLLSTSGSSNLDLVAIIVSVGVLLMVVSVVGIIICCYRHSQTTGFLDIAKIFRRGMSFARLQAQEEEDSKTNPFSQPENINFDNPLYNDPDAL